MQTSDKGIALIKEFEGCKLTAYQNSVGVRRIALCSCCDWRIGKRYWLQMLVVALIGVLGFFANHYRDNAIIYKDQRDIATVRACTSEAITNNVITTMNIICDTSLATQNAKNELAQKGETRIVYIR